MPKPFPFQVEGIRFIEKTRGCALVGDEMGLGKTVQALLWIELHPELRPVLIVTPASLKFNWEREIKVWMTKRCETFVVDDAPTPANIFKANHSDIVVINYDRLASTSPRKSKTKKGTPIKPRIGWDVHLQARKYRVVIADEIQYIKNRESGRSMSFKKIATPIVFKVFLSGTPILNRPAEFFPALNLLAPFMFPSWRVYANQYCDPKSNGFAMEYKGASNVKDLHQKLQPIMIRRLKKVVQPQLPPKLYNHVPIEIDNRAEYTKVEQGFYAYRNEKITYSNQMNVLAKLEYCRQAALKGKQKETIEWIKDFLDDTDEKLIVSGIHTDNLLHLYKTFKESSALIYGATPIKQRMTIVDTFQNDPKCRILFGQIISIGVGYTLTKCSKVAVLEQPWSPGVLDQLIDRVHRISQTSDTVNIYYLVARNTVEEKIALMLDKKREIVDKVLDGIDTPSENYLKYLLQL